MSANQTSQASKVPSVKQTLRDFGAYLNRHGVSAFAVADALCPPPVITPQVRKNNVSNRDLIEECHDLRPSSERMIKISDASVIGFEIDGRAMISANAAVKANAEKVESARNRVIRDLKDYVASQQQLGEARRFLAAVQELTFRAERQKRRADQALREREKKRQRLYQFVDLEAAEGEPVEGQPQDDDDEKDQGGAAPMDVDR